MREGKRIALVAKIKYDMIFPGEYYFLPNTVPKTFVIYFFKEWGVVQKSQIRNKLRKLQPATKSLDESPLFLSRSKNERNVHYFRSSFFCRKNLENLYLIL